MWRIHCHHGKVKEASKLGQSEFRLLPKDLAASCGAGGLSQSTSSVSRNLAPSLTIPYLTNNLRAFGSDLYLAAYLILPDDPSSFAHLPTEGDISIFVHLPQYLVTFASPYRDIYQYSSSLILALRGCNRHGIHPDPMRTTT